MKNKQNKKINRIDNFFGITRRGGTFRGELLGGVVNFLVLCYTVILIPNLMTQAAGEQLRGALLVGTILSIVVATLAMGIYGNLPLVLAPGIGIVSYMLSLVGAGKYTYHQTLAIAFIAAALFLILTITGLRNKIVNCMPKIIVDSLPIGVGLFIASIGLNSSNSGILDFLSGDFSTHTLIAAGVAIFAFIVICILHNHKVKGAIFYGILSGTVLDIIIKACMGGNPFEVLSGSWLPDFAGFGELAFKLDFAGIFVGDNVFVTVLSTLLIIFSFFLIDMFDTLGTLYGACKRGNLFDDKGNMLNAKRAMIIDSSSGCIGACMGLPTCTIYVESTAGISSGARTGLSSVYTALLFALMLFASPLISLIPIYATAPALIFVGVLMFGDIVNLDLSNFVNIVTAMVTILLMPLTGNITYGIAGGIIMYTLLQLFSGKGKQVNAFTYIVAILFVIYFATQGLV